MLCLGRESLRQKDRAAVQKLRSSIRDLVVLIDTSGTAAELRLAHQRIVVSRWDCEVARYDLEHHRAEHGC
jgi:hypothetical protein